MHSTKFPNCGHETAVPDCPDCGHAAVNGTAKAASRDSSPPAEVAGWMIERPSPKMLEEARRTFDEAEYLAGVREIEAGCGSKLEDFIDEIERITNGKK